MKKLLLLSPLLVSSHAFAQTSNDAQTDEDDEIIIIGEDGLADVYLLPLSYDRVPISADMAVAPITLSETSGVNMQSGSGQESLTAIRSPVLTGGAGAGSFAYLLNGVSLRAESFANINGFLDSPFELAETIELVRGSAKVTYGGNAQHGAVNSLTPHPKKEMTGAVTIGSDDFASARLTAGNENLWGGLSLTHDGGFRDASGYDNQKLLIKTDHDLNDQSSLRFVLSAVNLNQETAGFAVGPNAYRTDLAFQNPNPEAYRDTQNLLALAQYERDAGDWTVTLTPYYRYSDMEFRLHFLPGQAVERTDHSSLGLKSHFAVSRGETFLTFGLDADKTHGHLDEIQDAPTVFSFVTGTHYDFDVDVTTLSPFVQGAYDLNNNLEIHGGLRAEFIEYDYDNRTDESIVGRFLRPADRNDEFETFSADAGLRYRSFDGQTAYLRAFQGERAPLVSDLYRVQRLQTGLGADVERLRGLEAGWVQKGRDYQIKIEGYSYRKENFFFRDADGLNVTNGETSHRGLELNGDYDITRTWRLNGAMTIERHQYEFSRGVGNPSETIVEGNDVDTAPRVTAFAALRYVTDSWDAQLSAQHIGQYYTNAANTQDYPGHTVFGLRGRYDFYNDAYISARIDNLFDVRYADRADFAFGNERYFPGRPRTLYVTLGAQLN